MGKLVDNVFVLVSYASMMLLRCVVNTETLRRRTLAMQELLHVISAESPVALIVDDVHWADRLSTELLAGLVLHLDKAQLLLVTAARTLPKPSIADTSNAELTLRPLSEPEVFALLTSIAGVKGADWGGKWRRCCVNPAKGCRCMYSTHCNTPSTAGASESRTPCGAAQIPTRSSTSFDPGVHSSDASRGLSRLIAHYS